MSPYSPLVGSLHEYVGHPIASAQELDVQADLVHN